MYRGPQGGFTYMSKEVLIELFGYLGSFLVLISFLMTSVFKLIVSNTIGSVIFMIYAIIIKSYPTAVMNFFLVLINLRFLWKMRSTSKEYDLIRVNKDDKYLNYLLNNSYSDIRQCFPGIDLDLDNANRFYIINCDGKPVGITIGKEKNGTMDLILDYSMPEYRDFSIGKFMISHLPNEGITTLTYHGPDEHHTEYLNKLGFTKTEKGYELKL